MRLRLSPVLVTSKGKEIEYGCGVAEMQKCSSSSVCDERRESAAPLKVTKIGAVFGLV